MPDDDRAFSGDVEVFYHNEVYIGETNVKKNPNGYGFWIKNGN